ncbi:MAG: ATP-binding protein [Comamonas sp.]
MTQARILVIEDDFVVVRDLRNQLQRLGYQIAGSTPRGEGAAELARSSRADLVLADIRLEGPMDGTAAVREIRLHCDIPVVFLASYADHPTLQRASLADPQGYLLKPFDESQLHTAVEIALHKHAFDRKLRASENRFAATLASIGDAVISIGSDGLIAYMNPTAESLTGVPGAQAMGRELGQVYRVGEDDTGVSLDAQASLVLTDASGRLIPIEQSASPIIDARGRECGTVLVFRDLSERRAMEIALREAQAELSRASGLLTMAEFAACIAHEISQPLAAIVTHASAGLNWLRRPEPVLTEVDQVLGSVHAEGTRAASVVRGLHAIASKSGPELAAVDMKSAVQEVVLMIRDDLKRHQVRIQLGPFAEAAWVLGDRIQLQQVLMNLLQNGIEAISGQAGAGGLLTVRSERRRPGELTVSVGDSGAGFAPGHAERLFEAFFTTKKFGMGMGLAICQSIVDAHQGRIWAEPNTPRGTLISFTLPLTAA